MSENKLDDPNRGPVMLQYDPTQRDLTRLSPTVDHAVMFDDFRFKGFPDSDFHHAKQPKFRKDSAAFRDYNRVERFFGRPHHFDPGNTVNAQNMDNRMALQQFSPPPPQALQPLYQSPIPALQPPQRGSPVYPPPPMPMSPYQQYQQPFQLQGGAANPSKLEEAMDKGFQYGSIDHQKFQTEQSQPRPIRDPFGEKTSEPTVSMTDRSAEVEKIRQQQSEAEEDIRRHRQEQRQSMAAREEEKIKDMDMLQSYFPYGRPGGGAPLADNRKLKFTEHDLTPRDPLKYRDPNEPAYLPPIIWKSQDTEQSRPKPTIEDVRRSRDERKHDEEQLAKQEQKIRKLKHDIDLVRSSPLRRSKPDSSQHLKTRYTHGHSKGGGGAPNRTDSDSFTERRAETSMDVNEAELQQRRAPEYGRRDQYFDLRTKGLRQRMSNQERSTYYPFGKSGGGAPNRDKEGNILTTIYGKISKESTLEEQKRKARGAQNYLQELQKEMVEQQRNRDHMNNFYKVPGFDDLAVQMAHGQVGKPRRDPVTGMLLNHHLPNSDVSLQKTNFQPRQIGEKKRYHQDLENLAEDRFRRNQVDKLRERQESRLHNDTMGDYWGKYGGGAPKARNDYKKKNLVDIIHSPRREEPYRDYNKANDAVAEVKENLPTMFGPRDNSGQHKFLRSTVNSHHVNMYEYPESAVNVDTYHQTDAPFALHG